jgi:lysophospholipase L1-like esterase
MGVSDCALFQPMHEGYGFQFAVAAPLAHLKALAELDHAPVVVATLPLVTRFDDPICASFYDQVAGVARQLGFDYLSVNDAFQGEAPEDYLKPEDPMDKTHPNSAGHERMANYLAEQLRDRLPAAPGQ